MKIIYSLTILLALSGSCDAFMSRKKSSPRKDVAHKGAARKKTTAEEPQDNFKDIRAGFLAEIEKHNEPVIVIVLEELLRFNANDAAALPAEFRNEFNNINQTIESLSSDEQASLILSYLKRLIPYYSCADSRFARLLTEVQTHGAQLFFITQHPYACSDELFERLRQEGIYMQPLSFTDNNDMAFDLSSTIAHYKNGILFVENAAAIRDAFDALIEASSRATSISPILLGSAALLLGVTSESAE